jgi:WD40 repeat protein
VWDVKNETLLQTFTEIKSIFPVNSLVKASYNDVHRELVVLTKKILTVKCDPKIDLNLTDGYTHSTSVSVILFNKLFDFLVTCSISSTIIVWDVWKGLKVNLITRAHIQVLHGEVQLLPISAGCFDPKHQFLLTASDDGTIKVWNFNEGICLRTVKIENETRVSLVFWESERIFVIGEKSIAKFHDSKDSKMQITYGLSWEKRHRGAILCAAVRDLDTIVTSCSEGDLVFWNFITGRPFLRFNLANPTQELPVVYVQKLAESRDKIIP